MQRNLNAIRHVRENARWLKIGKSETSRRWKETSFAGSSLILSISPRSKRISHIWKYSREAGDQRQDLDYLSEGTARTHDSHKADFRTPWVPTVAVDRQPGRTWKMHQGRVVPIYRRCRQVAECVRNAKRGKERKFSACKYVPERQRIEDTVWWNDKDKKRKIAVNNYPFVL